MRIIILAAGHSFSMDGLVKCLIKNPFTKKTILQHAIEAFEGHDICVVAGYKAVEIIQEFPNLGYIVNNEWSITSNSYSLGLALDDRPCYVLSSDLLFDRKILGKMDKLDNAVLVENKENRTLTAIHCVVNSDDRIIESYVGPLRDVAHPEALGIYKITSPDLLREWKTNCLQHGNLFVGQNLPFAAGQSPILAVDKGKDFFVEINTPLDYLSFIDKGYTVS